MAKRKSYSEEFEREAVRFLVTRGERPVAEVAKGLGVGASQLYQWQQRYADVAKTALNGRGETKAEELARLRREVSVLRKEREIPKKSISLFVLHTWRKVSSPHSSSNCFVSTCSRSEALHAVSDFVENFCNAERMHSALDYLSPIEYEPNKAAHAA